MPNLTIYLLRQEIKTPEDAVILGATHYSISNDADALGDLFVAPRPAKPPSWAPMFSQYVAIQELGLVQSTGALFIAKVDGRLFALTFGHGRFILNQEAIEERFGLLVTLNSLESNALRSVDKKTFDTVDQNSRIQVGKISAAPEFGIDIERDLIKGIVGYPKDAAGLGQRLTGSDALTVSRDLNLGKLKKLLRRYLKAFTSKAYLKHFAWIDHIHQVRKSGHTAERLNGLLLEKLNASRKAGGLVDGCWLAIPDILDWSSVAGFRFSRRVKDGMHSDLHLPGFVNTLLEDDVLSLDLLRSRCAYAVNDEHQEIQHWSILKCLHCELEDEGKSYLLSGGHWFELNKDFVQSINDFYKSLPKFQSPLLIYNHSSEAEYNKALVDSDTAKWALMDAVPIPVGGIYDKVEFCDVFGVDGVLLHVKRYGGSNLLGHLFNQGLVSGELIRDHKDYLKLVNKSLPDTHKLEDDGVVPRDVSKLKVVFAIISQSDDVEPHLPFFARVALKNVYRRLESIGFTNIMVAKISCDPLLKKLVKVKAAKK